MRRRQLATSDAGAIVGTPLGLMGLGGRPASSPWACVVPTSLRVDAWADGDCIELIKTKKKRARVPRFSETVRDGHGHRVRRFFFIFFFFRPPLPATARHGVSRLPGSLSLTYGVDTSVYLWRRVPVQFFFFACVCTIPRRKHSDRPTCLPRFGPGVSPAPLCRQQGEGRMVPGPCHWRHTLAIDRHHRLSRPP